MGAGLEAQDGSRCAGDREAEMCWRVAVRSCQVPTGPSGWRTMSEAGGQVRSRGRKVRGSVVSGARGLRVARNTYLDVGRLEEPLRLTLREGSGEWGELDFPVSSVPS